MAERWLRSRSGTYDEVNPNNAVNVDMDSNSTYFESEADIAVSANPTVEVGVQNSESSTTLSNTTTSQLQDLLATVMTAFQAESSKQTAVFQTKVAKLTETLEAKFRQENEKLATSLTERFEAANVKLREEFNVKLQYEIQCVSESVDIPKRDNEHGIDNLNKSVANISEGMNAEVNAHIVQTRKELHKQGQEMINSSKVVLASINEHKTETEATVENLTQEINQRREHVESLLNTISGEVKSRFQERKNHFQSVTQAINLEIVKINKTISNLKERIIAGVASKNWAAIHQTAVVRMSTVGQTEGTIGTAGSDTSMNGVNGVNACDVSICSASVNVPNQSAKSCNKNVNTLSVVVPNGHNDLNELSLPKFSNSAKQVVAHFLRELDEYFALKKTPNEIKLPLCFRAIEDPFVKQWFATVYDTVGSYENFKTAFANLLWGQTRQAQIRCSIYQDHWDRRSEETYDEHYIRYVNDKPAFVRGGPSWCDDRSLSARSPNWHGLRKFKDNQGSFRVFK